MAEPPEMLLYDESTVPLLRERRRYGNIWVTTETNSLIQQSCCKSSLHDSFQVIYCLNVLEMLT